jgi:hypothetical protein
MLSCLTEGEKANNWPNFDEIYAGKLSTMKISGSSLSFSFALHILLPGLAHFWWREYLFGMFILLVMLLGSALALVAFLVEIPTGALIPMLGLPVFFYLFTFIDVARLVRRKHTQIRTGLQIVMIFVGIGVLYQVLAPTAPLNFILRNPPEIFVQPDNSLTPLYQQGDLLIANRLSYQLDLVIAERPILHSLPKRYEVVRYRSDSGDNKSGILLGLPTERIEVIEGVVVADNYPMSGEPPGGMILEGNLPLTHIGGYNVLIAQVHLGTIDKVDEIALTDMIGKVSRIL